MTAKVISVIVTYNPDPSRLMEQYHAIRNQIDGIVYVDNGSSADPFSDAISDNASVIYNKSNLGLGIAQNIGIRKAISQGATHILLLDDDSTPQPDMVAKLLDNFNTLQSQGEKVAVVGPRIRNLHLSESSYMKGPIISGFRIKLVPAPEKAPLKVSHCISSGSLIPTEIFEKVGFLNEKMFIDGLDVEWCLRAGSFGYNSFMSHNAVLGHRLGNGSSNRIMSHSPQREYYIVRNFLYLSKLKHLPRAYRIRRRILCLSRPIKSLFSGNFTYARQGFKGIIDGIKMK